jgi:hypothetical protein
MRFGSLIKYLFPALSAKQKLPLLPREWTSEKSRTGEIPKRYADAIHRLKVHGLARTDQDAMRLLKKFQGKSIDQIVRQHKRKRRRESRIKRAIKRFSKLW